MMYKDLVHMSAHEDVFTKASQCHEHNIADLPGLTVSLAYPKYQAVREHEVRVPTVDGTVTLDLTRGRVFTPAPLTGTTTIAIINHPPGGVEVEVTLFLPQDAVGGRVVIWPTNVSFDPVPPPAGKANQMSVITLTTWDGGVTYRGTYAGGGQSNAGQVTNSFDVIISDTKLNLNLRDYVVSNTTWDGVSVVDVQATVTATGVIGSNDPTKVALDIGQFPTGSVVSVQVYGSIDAAGGAINSGRGGDAINANYPNQTTTVVIQGTGKVRAGGGGGGKGGNGGGGYYSTTGTHTDPIGWTLLSIEGVLFPDCNKACKKYFGGSSYCTSGGTESQNCGIYTGESNNGAIQYTCNSCVVTTTSYTSGGIGGSGGRGSGYGISSTTGNAGASGGTNAGTGGVGANGGTWGAYGATGGTGTNGNYTSGQAGAMGGSPGYALIKASASASIINAAGGTLAGGIL